MMGWTYGFVEIRKHDVQMHLQLPVVCGISRLIQLLHKTLMTLNYIT